MACTLADNRIVRQHTIVGLRRQTRATWSASNSALAAWRQVRGAGAKRLDIVASVAAALYFHHSAVY